MDNKDMLLENIMKALEMSGIKFAEPKGSASGLDGFEPDPRNKVKGWSGISLVKGGDDRPKLADKDYVIEKLGMHGGQEMPHDSAGGGGYARPF